VKLKESGNRLEGAGSTKEGASPFFLLHTSGLPLAPLSREPQGQLANQKPSWQGGIPSFRKPGYIRVGLDPKRI